ncbi:hypothetical protein BDW02DRAFT_133833 [Decorospora gaudefroyi]|uniref:Heterokaryon incompatibility domain-containing protein n=1 Tax=Decorospora gaudefroyi TaxID=184978 RepID=A0A6A5K131_9PLEO|nr:hypothetical protein BDW02DRAFT_133833 [Decorospora gaudefroyi]
MLVNNEWFERLWVVQEVYFAKRITCLLGSYKVKWEKLHAMQQTSWRQLGRIEDNHRFALDEFDMEYMVTTFDIRRSALGDRRSSTLLHDLSSLFLLEIAHSTARYGCSVPRDRVNALLGLLPTESDILDQINTDTDEVDLFCLFWHNLFHDPINTTYMAVWAMLGYRSTVTSLQKPAKSLDLPSWCPDTRWSNPNASNLPRILITN